MTSLVEPAAIAVEPFAMEPFAMEPFVMEPFEMELIVPGPLGLGLLGCRLSAMVIAFACRGYRVG